MIGNWKPDPDFWGYYCHVPLSNKTTMFFSVTELKVAHNYNAEMIVTDHELDVLDSEWYDSIWNDTQGTPTGPGGTEAWGIASTLLTEAEELIREDDPQAIMSIGGATEKLFRIYERFLPRRGYTRVAGDMLKVLT